jgi:sporulation protein YlmC with PRC-barrel domain
LPAALKKKKEMTKFCLRMVVCLLKQDSSVKEGKVMNKTKYLLIVVVSVFSLVLWGGRSFAQYDDMAGGTVQSYYESTGWGGTGADWLIGHSVYSPIGGYLGQIDNLAIDRSDGHIALVILSDVPGFGDRLAVAPFSALERTGESTFQLNFGDRDIPVAVFPTDRYANAMAMNIDTISLSRFPSAIDPLWADTVYRFYGQTPYWTEGDTVHPDIAAYRASDSFNLVALFGRTEPPALLGSTIRSSDGTTMARIDDLVIDSKDCRVALVVVDEVPGRGDVMVAVPFSELSVSGDAFAFNFTGDRLASAPVFMFADADNPRYARDVYVYFGLQPYWTIGE